MVVLVGAGRISSTLPVVLVVAVVAVLIVVSEPWHGLLIVLAATALLPVPFSVHVGPVTASVGRVLGWALALGWLAARSRADRPVRRRRTPLDIPILLLIGAMVLSTIANIPSYGSGELGGAIRKLAVFGIDYALLFWIAVSVLHERGRVERLLRYIAGLAILAAVLGLVERATGQNVFSLLAPVLPPGVNELIREIGKSSTEGLARGGLVRIRSTFEGPLPFGIVLLFGLPLSVTFALIGQTYRTRMLWVLGASAIGASLLLTASRSVYLLGAFTIVALLVLLPDRSARIAVVAAGAAIATLFLVQGDVRKTMLVFFQPEHGVVLEGSLQARVDDYTPVLGLVSHKPLLGYGPRTFAKDTLQSTGRVDNPENLVLDNVYLGQLAEGGVIGLLMLGGFSVACVVVALRARRAAITREELYIGSAMVAVVVSWVSMGFAADVYTFNAPPRLFFAALAALAITRARSGWREPFGGGGPPPGAIATAPAPAR